MEGFVVFKYQCNQSVWHSWVIIKQRWLPWDRSIYVFIQ